ncbi:hypothetical protein [Candidatus Phycosocius spiralis]|uniref:Uncharacterized protein n=1 Tax=Candidatus Phycosocius spiralis TaxID=2815099 RepID=A0ABQ4PWF8_9PROT|nr:hypothetical protein [Candidatus Phycosocius spiralis]GIU67008.1 hypothetical protein PsB1_1162 [Candidatus Phycosocius spiralis]
MIELGPQTLHFQTTDGQSEAFEVSIFVHPPKEEGTPDHEDGLAYYGEVMLTFAQHERRMKVSCENNIQLVGTLMMFAESYIMRQCDVQNLTVYRHIPGDIKVPTDMFR